jgi:hypothetical protein
MSNASVSSRCLLACNQLMRCLLFMTPTRFRLLLTTCCHIAHAGQSAISKCDQTCLRHRDHSSCVSSPSLSPGSLCNSCWQTGDSSWSAPRGRPSPPADPRQVAIMKCIHASRFLKSLQSALAYLTSSKGLASTSGHVANGCACSRGGGGMRGGVRLWVLSRQVTSN